MNFLKLILFSLFIVGFAACNKDDNSPQTCTQSDWLGIYEGSIDCDGDKGSCIITIIPSGSTDVSISYVSGGASTTYTAPFTPDNCSIVASSTISGSSISVDIKRDGNKLTLKEIITAGGQTYTCNLSTTKK